MSDLVIWGRAELSQLRDEFDKRIEEFCREYGLRGSRSAGPRILERGDVVEAVLQVPGLRADDLEVQVFERRIRISGSRELSEAGAVRFSSFHHEASLPARVEPGKSTALLEGGTLVVTMPKARESEHQVLKIAE